MSPQVETAIVVGGVADKGKIREAVELLVEIRGEDEGVEVEEEVEGSLLAVVVGVKVVEVQEEAKVHLGEIGIWVRSIPSRKQ